MAAKVRFEKPRRIKRRTAGLQLWAENGPTLQRQDLILTKLERTLDYQTDSRPRAAD